MLRDQAHHLARRLNLAYGELTGASVIINRAPFAVLVSQDSVTKQETHFISVSAKAADEVADILERVQRGDLQTSVSPGPGQLALDV